MDKLVKLFFVVIFAVSASAVSQFPSNPTANDYWEVGGVRYQYPLSGNWNPVNSRGTKSPFEYSSALDDSGLQVAITAIGSTETTLLIDKSYAIDDSLSIPANITLQVVSSGGFVVANTKTLTISGKLSAGFYQIFSGSGAVAFSNVVTVLPQWWGLVCDNTTDTTTSIQSAINSLPAKGGRVFFDNINNNCRANITITKDNVRLQGTQKADLLLYGWMIQSINNSLPVIQIGDGVTQVRGVSIDSIGISGRSGQYSKGLLYYGNNRTFVTNFAVEGFTEYGIKVSGTPAIASKLVYIDNFTIQNMKAGASGASGFILDTTSHLAGGIFLSNGYIGNSVDVGNGYSYGIDVVTGMISALLFANDVYVQGMNERGVRLQGTSIIQADGLHVDSDNSADVLVNLTTATDSIYIGDRIQGSVSIDGLVKYDTSGNTIDPKSQRLWEYREMLANNLKVTNLLKFSDTGATFVNRYTTSACNMSYASSKVGIGCSASVTGEFTATGVSSDGTGKVVCIKADGNLGTCSDQPNASGVCTCG